MSITLSTIYQRAARIMGGRTGTVVSVTPATVNTVAYYDIVLDGLIHTTGDDTYYAGDRLMFVGASTHTCTEGFITSWTDSTGTARVLQAGVTVSANDTYILSHREDYVLNEYRQAIDKALNQTPRTYRQVIALTPLLRQYPLSVCDWLTGDGDVNGVFLNYSPLMLHNEDFSLWQNGAASAPDGYTLEGTGATVARVSGGLRSNYAATLTAGSGGTLRLVQAIPESLSQWITRRTFPIYIPVRAAAWVKTTNANSVRVFIRYVESSSGSPVTTYAYSDYITADGSPQYPSVDLTPSATQDQYEWGIEVTTNGHAATVSWAGMMQNTISFSAAYQIKDSGSQAIPYLEYPTNHVVRNIGGVPYVELSTYPATWGQLCVYVRRPFPAYSSDSDTYDDQYARVLTAGLLVFLTEARKPDQMRDRLDVIRREQQLIWTRMATQITDLPIPRPPTRWDITGA